MARPADLLIERPADLSADWLTAILGQGRISGFTTEGIGTGQMSECYRVALTYADTGAGGPTSVVLKVAAADPNSRQTGLALGLYEREARFYTDIAPGLPGPVAPCHHAAFDPETGAFHLDIRGHAPVRLTADDGRISYFPRAWAAVATGDGRTGIGWLEW
ncbi:MAG: phosphotransferase, partial [Mycobacterium sp.]